MHTLPRPLRSYIRDEKLLPIADKVAREERLTFEDGLLLYETRDLNGIGAMAHHVRMNRHGLKTYFVASRRLSYTNICYTHCQFCAFQAKPGDPRAYVLSAEDIIKDLEKPESAGVRELHMVAGHYPKLKIEYFEDLFRKVKARFPDLHLKVFTMVEMDYYARVSGITMEEFLDRCVAAGLESCPGGGAEIFEKRVRDVICRDKISGERWLELAKLCHENGVKTNVTMLYGSVETIEDRVDHLVRIRELQDVTGGFLGFIPLAFHPEETQLPDLPAATGMTDLKVIAVSRLMLDNVDHVKAYWVQIGEKLAPVALHFGADDLVGTVMEETITHAAGATTEAGLTRAQMEALIRGAGREPFERDAYYERVVRDADGQVLRANRHDFAPLTRV